MSAEEITERLTNIEEQLEALAKDADGKGFEKIVGLLTASLVLVQSLSNPETYSEMEF